MANIPKTKYLLESIPIEMKLKESQLRKIIAETIAENVNYSTLSNAVDKVQYGDSIYNREYLDFGDVKDALRTIQIALDRYSGSFHPLHGQAALNYFYDNKRAPHEGQANKCIQYLDYIRAFFDRKEKQFNTFSNTADSMKKDYDSQILSIARQNGAEGDDVLDALWDLYEKNGEDEDTVIEMFPKNIQDYIRHESLL